MRDLQRFEKQLQNLSAEVEKAGKPDWLDWEEIQKMSQVDLLLAFSQGRCANPGMYMGFRVANAMNLIVHRVMQAQGVSRICLNADLLFYAHLAALIREAAARALNFDQNNEFQRSICFEGTDEERLASLRNVCESYMPGVFEELSARSQTELGESEYYRWVSNGD